MKKFLAFCVISLICGNAFATLTGLATDVLEPSWRGDDNTTLQAWSFNADDNPAYLDPSLDMNPYGTPVASIKHSDGSLVSSDDSDTHWMEEHPQFGGDTHFGVWRFYGSDYLELYIPNDPVERDTKLVYIQMTYDASNYPVFSTSPGYADIELVDETSLDSNYDRITLLITIEPNPELEIIELRPNDCTMYIDEIVVDTICIPEPATIALLGFGVLGLLRKQKA